MSEPQQDAAARVRRLEALHTATYPDLLRFVERRVPASEAEDIVSSVFEVAWRRLDAVPEDARPWLFAVARKVMANAQRGARRRAGLDVRLADAASTGVTTDAAHGGHARHGAPSGPDAHSGVDARVDLVRAWRVLAPRDREVLALVAFEGLTTGQGAVVLGTGRSAFAMRLARARHRLQQALHADDDSSAAPTPTAARSTRTSTTGGARTPARPAPTTSTGEERTWTDR